jgi:hypothetical protein
MLPPSTLKWTRSYWPTGQLGGCPWIAHSARLREDSDRSARRRSKWCSAPAVALLGYGAVRHTSRRGTGAEDGDTARELQSGQALRGVLLDRPVGEAAAMAEIALAEVVRALRVELEDAMREGAGQSIRFEATSLDLEFNVGVKKSSDAKAGIRFWVLELGGGGSYASESIQTVRLSLEPITEKGTRVRITRGTEESPLSSDREPTGE